MLPKLLLSDCTIPITQITAGMAMSMMDLVGPRPIQFPDKRTKKNGLNIRVPSASDTSHLCSYPAHNEEEVIKERTLLSIIASSYRKSGNYRR